MIATKTPKDIPESTFEPPQEEIDALARVLFPAIMKYFESEQGKHDFEIWEKANHST
jgi:hypothetical protein